MVYNNYFSNCPGYYLHNGGIVSVRNIQEALNYPIAPGNIVMFKDENSPFIYVKTKGFSQFEEPIFEKYRLVKEEQPQPVNNNESVVNIDYALKRDLQATQDALLKQINDLQARFDSLAKKEVN